MRAAILTVSMVLLLAPGLAAAQSSAEPAVVRPVRLEQPPRIDGRLDEPLWETVEPVSEFFQYEPRNGEPATERTEIRIAYDERFLYFGIRAYDPEPELIVIRQFERDSFIDADDSISLAIDSLDDDRTALAFQTNTAGTKLDLQMTEAGAFNLSWDTIWYARGNVDELGYTVEIAIPFFSLRFKPAQEVEMGINLERIIRRKNEKVNWPYLSRDYSFSSVSQYARMVGMRGIERGVDLEIKPYGIAGLSEVPDERVGEADAGLDVKWGLNSNVTADLTLNPDFAQVESDDLRVNLTRFNLFFPEKRDFFLERADLFRFGLPQEAEVFFSRRIGIREGREVPIIVGARGYGQPGSTNFGLMTMQTAATGDFESESFSVARLKQNVLGRSYIGGIFTQRRGELVLEDTTIGGDFEFVFGTNTRFEAAVARSDRPGVESGNWLKTATMSESKDRYDWVVQYVDVGENFAPGIGFVRRPDQRRWMTNVHYKPRPDSDLVRQLTFGLRYARVENQRGVLESESFRPGFLVMFESEDQAVALYWHNFERVTFSFAIAPDVVIPPGDYYNRQVTLRFQSAPGRPWGVVATHTRGGFYGGTIASSKLVGTYKPIPRVHLTSQSQYDDVDVPGGAFDSWITRFLTSYHFSPELTSRIAVQYSSLFDEFVINARVRWIYTPGSEAWLVYDEGRRFRIGYPSLEDRALILKLVHNFHF